jgi:tRNA(Ile)-lysidine synthase
MVANSLIEKFKSESVSQSLFNKSQLVIVAISGGLDSVVLTHLLKSIQQPIMLAHCNFQLRGAESERDEQFVSTLAREWKIPLHIRRFETKDFAKANKLSIQVAARQLRYGFFDELRQLLSGQGREILIATAHHANDNVETVLMNLFRGTGIAGLKGIPQRNGAVIRPLLFAHRGELEAYAREHNLTWVEDSSNEKEDYTRNYIRHTIIPALEKQYPTLVQNIHASTQVFSETADLYHEAVERRLKKLIATEQGMEKIPVLKVEKMLQAATVVFEWIRRFGFSHGQTGEALKLTTASNGSYVASATHRLIRNRAWLLMAPLQNTSSALKVVEALPYETTLDNGSHLHIDEVGPYEPATGIPKLPENEALLDASGITLPLIIRRWKQGDYFYPLGMRKKKKIARFLIDSKVSPLEKEHVWVIESRGRIVWVVGHRIDDRFKITGGTKEVVSLSWIKRISSLIC